MSRYVKFDVDLKVRAFKVKICTLETKNWESTKFVVGRLETAFAVTLGVICLVVQQE